MKKVPKLLTLGFLLVAVMSCVSFKPPTSPVVLRFIETTDVHGSLFPYDFITNRPLETSLAQLSTFVNAERADASQHVILLDNGDICQGQPVVYYYNFENTKAPHILAEVMNSLGYDAGTLGNHDIEAGHPVYDRLVKAFRFPWLAANAVKPDGSPYFTPYTIIKRGGLTIAVIGLVTPWIPNWLPQQFWSGMRFEDMVAAAGTWVKIVRDREKPDLVVGLFHSGTDFTYGGLSADTPFNENASELVAARVPGFDIIFTGHDHLVTQKVVKSPDGRDVHIFGAQNAVRNVSAVTVTMRWNPASASWEKTVTGEVKSMAGIAADGAFTARFAPQFDEVKAWVSRPIGAMTNRISTRDSMFGDSAFVDLIHTVQLGLTGNPDYGLNAAQISFAAPLSLDAAIPTSRDGTLYVRDMFNLYKYENFLYTMSMTGRQVKDFLEYSYALWMDTMQSDSDHIIKFKRDASGNLLINDKTKMPVPAAAYYNYDSAAGIRYTVDVTKPAGSRVSIASLSDGSPFDPNRTYSVAINSYRAQGGGGHLTQGAKMDDAEVKAMKYVTSSTIKDLRFYILKWIEARKEPLSPLPLGTWSVQPQDWVKKARILDTPLLFGK